MSHQNIDAHNIDLLVIGGGTAGCAAATTVARSRMKTLVIDHGVHSGFLGSYGNISYFPGVAEAVSGTQLVERFRRQAEAVGATFSQGRVVKIEAGSKPSLQIEDGRHFEARAVLIASGAADRTNYLQGEKEFMGRGVSHDAAMDGPVFFQQRIAVVGKNAVAAHEALKLARFASHVLFVIPSSKLDADEALQKELRNSGKIEMLFSASLKKINGLEQVTSITVFTAGQEKDIEVDGVFPYVHDYRAANEYAAGVVEMDSLGAIKIDSDFKTTADGVFACGDALSGRPQLPAVACAQGILAGLSIDRYLRG